MILQFQEFLVCVNSRTKAAHFLELLCFFPFFFFFFFFFFLFLEKEGCAARFVSFSSKPYRKFLDLLIVFQLLVFFSHSLGFFGRGLIVFGQVIISSFVLLKFLTFWSGISLAPFAFLENRGINIDKVFNIIIWVIYLIIFNEFIY